MSEIDRTAERLLIVKFPVVNTQRSIEKMLRKFIESVNRSLDGSTVRLFSVGRTWDQPYTDSELAHPMATLAIWYPTEGETDAPISVEEVKMRLHSFAANGPWAGHVYFLEPTGRVNLHEGPLRYNEAIQSRDLYMYRRGLITSPTQETPV